MTEKETQQYHQAQQDAITLDYSKWSDQQRRAKLSTDHDLWQQQRDAVLRRQQSDNAEARRKYLDGLAEQRKAKQDEADAELELSLTLEKQQLRNAWLADHPNDTAADFEKKAWHHLKANLIEQRKAAAMEANTEQLKQTGRYSL